jgi:hypothetical protein
MTGIGLTALWRRARNTTGASLRRTAAATARVTAGAARGCGAFALSAVRAGRGAGAACAL